MRGYDWDFGFGFGREYEAHRQPYEAWLRRADYDAEYRGGFPPARRVARPWRPGYDARRGYDRGVYGDLHPGFGGVPSGSVRGMYYPRGRGGYGRDVELGGAWGRPGADYPPMHVRRGRGQAWVPASVPWDRGGRAGAYDPAPDAGRFLPERAYRAHPQLERPPHRPDAWPGGAAFEDAAVLDDEEIRQAVRQSLFQDGWLDADAIEVDVEDGVVTLQGEVDDYLQARFAWDDAWETEGVRGVLNHLTVRAESKEAEEVGGTESTGSRRR